MEYLVHINFIEKDKALKSNQKLPSTAKSSNHVTRTKYNIAYNHKRRKIATCLPCFEKKNYRGKCYHHLLNSGWRNPRLSFWTTDTMAIYFDFWVDHSKGLKLSLKHLPITKPKPQLLQLYLCCAPGRSADYGIGHKIQFPENHTSLLLQESKFVVLMVLNYVWKQVASACWQVREVRFPRVGRPSVSIIALSASPSPSKGEFTKI